ncbi:MAG: hypothetical protein J6Z38_05265, partial [Lachnospiraceae bacterium]|nr:hypothetical protein [Lachnospiraceae bacterium]
CYRLKGEGADTIKKNDVIKVSGILTNYVDSKSGKSKIEFTAGCKLLEIVEVGEAEPEVVYGSEAEIVAAAYALADGDSLSSNQTLTGKITKVKTAYDASFGNITVIISCQGKDIQCYRMKGTGVETLKVGDTIKVSGILKNYQGTIEFDAGCQLVEIVAVGAVVNYGTQDQIVDAAYALGANESLVGDQTLTGVITKVNTAYDAGYQNVSVTIVVNGKTDKPIYCYRIKGAGADTIKVGDTITVTGLIKNYVGTNGNSTIEFDAGSKLVSVVPGQGGGESGDSDKIVLNSVIPEAGKPYKMAIAQQKLKKALYFDGAINGSGFLTTVETEASGADVYLEETNGGYFLYFTESTGVKKYVTLTANGKDKSGHQKAKISLTAEGSTVFTIDNTYKTLFASIEGSPMYLGTYNEYNTFSASEVSFLTAEGAYDVSQFPAQFLVSDGSGQGGEGEETDELTFVQPEPEKAYKLVVDQKTAGKVLYFNGTTGDKDYWLATTENIAEAVDVYVESVDGGLNLYFFDANSNKQYITIAMQDGTARAGITEVAVNPYTYDEAFQTLIATISQSVEGDMTPEEIVDAAYALEGGKALSGARTLTGTVTAINTAYSEDYGNITVTIVVENRTEKPIQCFRMKANPNVVGMETAIKNLAVGDVITVTGTLKNYVDKNSKSTIEFDANCTLDVLTTAGGTTISGETEGDLTADYFLGTYNTYTTLSANNAETYLTDGAVDVTQFP